MEAVNYLPPALALVVLPLYAIAVRAGWLARRPGRIAVLAVAVAAVVAGAPWGGAGLEAVKRLDLALAALTLSLICAHRWRLGPLAGRGAYLRSLTAAAAMAVVVYLNFFSFHGARTFVHLHDVAHYYLGAKYFGELGYRGLYTAMLRAEAEVYDDRFKTLEARDLSTDRLVHIRTLLEASEPVKDAFTAHRWQAFQRDVARFRERLGANQPTFYRDHGFNATPFWALLGGALANRVPAGDDRGVLLLTLIDPLLIAGLLAAVAWAFGVEAMLLATIYLCIAYGATFGWVGGAFLRYGWLFGLVTGLCCLARGRARAAGVLFAAAVLLRGFPALFLVGFAAVALSAWRRGAPLALYRRFATAGAAAGVAFFLLTGLLPQGFGAWSDFRANTRRYVATVSPNVVGLTPILAFQGRPTEVTAEVFDAIQARRARIHRWQLLLIFAPLALWMARRVRRWPLPAAMVAGGLVLAFAGFNLAAYYWAFLLLTLLGDRGGRTATLLFAQETLVHALHLFEDAEGMLFLYRSVLVLYLLAALYAWPGVAVPRPASATRAQTTP